MLPRDSEDVAYLPFLTFASDVRGGNRRRARRTRRPGSNLTSASHRQNDAELCVAAHHPRVSLSRFFERIGFNYGANPC